MSGIPIIKYHLRILWRKINIPMYTPMLPKTVAIKNNIPSEILLPLSLSAFDLSMNMSKKALTLVKRKKYSKYNVIFSIKIYFYFLLVWP